MASIQDILTAHHDLVTPDGKIQTVTPISKGEVEILLRIEKISPAFMGFEIDLGAVFFNLKSTLAQLGLDSVTEEIVLDKGACTAEVRIRTMGIGRLGQEMLGLLAPGMNIGKLFAADERRRVRDPHYLLRMFGRSDRERRPLLSLGGMHGSDDLIFEKIEGRTVAYLRLREGRIEYEETIWGLIPTIAKALESGEPVRELLHLHQIVHNELPRIVEPEKILLVRTLPLHIRTVFGSVANDLLPQGFRHTTASVLQPDTMHSGDVYELHGSSMQEINDIPLEFYTLEPYREHVFFEDRDQLQEEIERPETLFGAFETAPAAPDQAATFVVKGEQLLALETDSWIQREALQHEWPGFAQGTRQGMMVERYIEKQAAYPFLHAIEEGKITSQGILLMRYFPSPVLKRALLSEMVHRAVRGIYFQEPSLHYDGFFSHEDRAFLIDLAKFAIPVYWVDPRTNELLLYVQRSDKDSGMFVPIERVGTFLRAVFFGIYGSNLLEGDFEGELRKLLSGLDEMKDSLSHPMLNADTPLAMVTGGGPGAMEVGNRVAKELGILSCANLVDFRQSGKAMQHEQKQNPYVEAKMTYRIDKLVERQAEFHLDFPIFLQGGIGTDFEYALEEVRNKTGVTQAHPILLFGAPEYWRAKITSRWQLNLRTGTIKGSEWVSNCFFCVQHAEQGLAIYRSFLDGSLKIGPDGPTYEQGFVT